MRDLLAKDPTHRPATATQVQERLIAILTALAVDAPTEVGLPAVVVADVAAPTTELSRPTGRHRTPALQPRRLQRWPEAREWLREWWVAVLSGALILATVLTVTVVLTGRDTDQTSTAAAAAPASAPPLENQPSDALPTADPTSPPVIAAPGVIRLWGLLAAAVGIAYTVWVAGVIHRLR